MKYKVKGLIVPSLSFFNKDGSLDTELFKEHLSYCLEEGADGFFACGTYGSASLLSIGERLTLFEIAKNFNCPTIAHVGSVSKEDAVILAKEAEKIGVDAISALEPLDEKLDDEELISFYYDIMEAAPNTDFYAYNNPNVSGRVLSDGLIKKLALMGAKAVKDSTVSLELAKKDLGLKYIAGSSKNWADMARLGHDTVISGMANYTPGIVKSFMKLCLEKPEKADEAQAMVNELNNFTRVAQSNIESAYIAVKASGRDAGFMRTPADYSGILKPDYAKYKLELSEIGYKMEETKIKLHLNCSL